MKGLYLNVDKALCTKHKINGQKIDVVELDEFGLQGKLVYSNELWDRVPILNDEKRLFIVSGWFIYKNTLNNIDTLYRDFLDIGESVFAKIELGNFLIVLRFENELQIFNDLMGLSTHYYLVNEDRIRLAPTAALLAPYTSENKTNIAFMTNQGHLYDNHTTLNDVFRFEPGSKTNQDGEISIYGTILDKNDTRDLDQVPSLIKDVTEVFPKESRVLALSGGLDSRLMLAASEYQFGYTYGPEGSGDRVIARNYSDDFEKYFEFTIQMALGKNINSSDICAWFFKYNSTWIPSLMEAYSYARAHSGEAHVLFDGYLGDVFQRGTFIKFTGILGSLFKMFPFLYRFPFSERFILKQRYCALDNEQFESLYSSFLKRTKNLPLDGYQKVTFYETVYGRGARYVINGGNVTANQLFTDVPVFMSKKVFNSFIFKKFEDAVSYHHLAKVWRLIPEKYKTVRADSGLKPDTSPIIAPFINVCYRFMVRFVPSLKNYGAEINEKS